MRQIDRLHYMDSSGCGNVPWLGAAATVVFALWTNDVNRPHNEPSKILNYVFEFIHLFRMQLFFLVAGFSQ